jgi:nicotinate phosphoribosyltransferase
MTDPKHHTGPTPSQPQASDSEKRRLDALLDEALDQTFPASDPPSLTQPAPDGPSENE